MSRHRVHIPIYALTPKLVTQRKMAIYRNVRPLLMDQSAEFLGSCNNLADLLASFLPK